MSELESEMLESSGAVYMHKHSKHTTQTFALLRMDNIHANTEGVQRGGQKTCL